MTTPFDVFNRTLTWARSSQTPCWHAEEVDSTNSVAKNDQSSTRPVLADLTQEFSGPSLYLARKQTQGRGRGAHTWTTPDGSSLLSSWSFAVGKVPQPIFSAAVGLALYEAAVQAWPGIAFNIKAPNDLFIGAKKTAGILIETIDQANEKRTVIGIGMNVVAAPIGMATATSIGEHLEPGLNGAGGETAWSVFLEELRTRLRDAVRSGQKEKLETNERERLCLALNRHPLLTEPILNVDELGQLHSASRVVRWQEL